jgi:hypothetical protein
MKHSYEINPRPVELGGGWRLRLLEDGEEAGGGVFPVMAEPNAGMTWWNECSEQERSHWVMMAASARPADAYHAYQLAEAYADAESTAYKWIDSRGNV